MKVQFTLVVKAAIMTGMTKPGASPIELVKPCSTPMYCGAASNMAYLKPPIPAISAIE